VASLLQCIESLWTRGQIAGDGERLVRLGFEVVMTRHVWITDHLSSDVRGRVKSALRQICEAAKSPELEELDNVAPPGA
jgi:hypothetical protein